MPTYQRLFTDFPIEIVVNIIKHLETCSLNTFSQTNHIIRTLTLPFLFSILHFNRVEALDNFISIIKSQEYDKYCKYVKSITIYGRRHDFFQTNHLEIFKYCKNISSLSLIECNSFQLDDADDFFKNTRNLQKLHFTAGAKARFSRNEDELLAQILKLKSIKHLTLSGRGITDTSVSIVAQQCRQLESFSVRSGNILSVTNLSIGEILHNCTLLKSLSVSVVDLTHYQEPWSVKCNNLEKLAIIDSKLENESILSLLSQFTKLKKLQVSNSKLESFHAIFPDLVELNVADTLIDDSTLLSVAWNCPKLEKLFVGRTNVTDVSVCAIAQSCSHLKVFEAQKTSITQESINSLIQECPLKQLNIAETLITDLNFNSDLKNSKLTHLNMSNVRVSEANIIQITKSSPYLIELDVSNITSLSMDAFKSIAKTCSRIVCLSAARTNISFTDIQYIAQEMKNLKTINLSFNKHLDISCLELFCQPQCCLRQVYIWECFTKEDKKEWIDSKKSKFYIGW